MDTTSVRLPKETLRRLDHVALTRGVARSDVIRDALEAWMDQTQAAPAQRMLSALDGLMTYPGSGVGDLAQNAEVHLRERFRARRRSR